MKLIHEELLEVLTTVVLSNQSQDQIGDLFWELSDDLYDSLENYSDVLVNVIMEVSIKDGHIL